ncbi:MAG: glutamine synthetase beta-grasp domain-containing protein [Acidobacteriota bacterium]|nr:glutamine synthetase beta-grasp domain-containing protein [Acidobacteriota bacterium]
MSQLGFAEYIWLDGAVPVRNVRSKTRIIPIRKDQVDLASFPTWSFDGSSTYQSHSSDSDLTLKPVNFYRDPLRGAGSYLVLCEVLDHEGQPHCSNTRALLRQILEHSASKDEPWIGFEQEYTLYRDGHPLGFLIKGAPRPQGPYYCGVSIEDIFGREFVEDHTRACLEAGLAIYGINAEVMPGQWEFQLGYRGLADEEVGALEIADQLWVARWLLYRIGENHDILPSLSNKPMSGDWNGAGCHTNFSTKAMRDPGGISVINHAMILLKDKHKNHIKVYGHELEKRLTGQHETSRIDEFRHGIADRGSSIRIPYQVMSQGCGYFEDRRPGANCDPYQVAARLIKTIVNLPEDQFEIHSWGLQPDTPHL